MPENSTKKLGLLRWVMILIFLVVFVAISYGIIAAMYGANPNYPIWEITVVTALLWLGYAILIYIIVEWDNIGTRYGM